MITKNTSPFVYPILFIAFLIIPAVSSAQEVLEENSPFAPKIGYFPISYPQKKLAKTNSALFKGNYQHFKKAVAYLTYRDPNKSNQIIMGTGFLINTVENTNLDVDGSPLLYFLTAAHNNVPVVGKPGNSIEPEDPVTKDIYLSFDFEIANPELNVEPNYENMNISEYEKQNLKNEFIKIKRLWRIKLEIAFIDIENDLALYKIKPLEDYPWSIDESEVFQHVYTLGWNTRVKDIKSPESKDAELKAIGHPLGDTKIISTRLLSNYEIVQHASVNGKNFEIKTMKKEKQYRILKRLIPSFPRYNFEIPKASSGSPILNFENKVLSVHQGRIGDYLKTYSGLIQNCWHYRNDIGERENDLQTYLDQNNTYISKISGGYVRDLVKNNHEEINYDLTVDSDGIQIPVSLDHIHFFGFNKYDIYENRLGYGIHIDPIQEPLAPGNSINLKLTDKNGSEIFKAIYSTENININERTHFKFYNDVEPVINLDNDFFGEALIEFNNALLENIEKQAETEIKKLSEAKLDDATLSIYTTGETQQVRAVKLPLLPAYNARELFEENPYAELWRSYKYKESRGIKSENYHITNIKVDFEQYLPPVESSGECIKLNTETLQTISTGDNGGYLNLMNPNYIIKDLITSEVGCPKNKLTLTLATPSITNKYYGAWLDYFKERKEGGQMNSADDYTYNFVYDASEDHNDELLELNNTSEQSIVITHEVPLEEDLPFTASKEIRTKLRLAVAKQPQSSELNLTQDGIYEEGEVEDYLITIRPSDCKDKKEYAKNSKGLLVSIDDSINTGVSDCTDSPSASPSTPTISGSQTCHEVSGECADMNTCSTINLVSDNTTAWNFNSTDSYIDLNTSGLLETETTTNSIDALTLSFYTYVEQDLPAGSSQYIFSLGDDNNGLTLRQKEGNVEVGITTAGISTGAIVLGTTLPTNKWVNVTVVYDGINNASIVADGQIKLYLDNVEVSVHNAPDALIFSDTNTLESTFADATNSTLLQNVFTDAPTSNDAIVSFDSALANLTIYSSALSAAEVEYFNCENDFPIPSFGSGFESFALSQTDETQKSGKEINHDKELGKPTYDFSIFPNPATDQLNILVEVSQEGPLQIDIYDMNGRQVYTFNRPKITQGHQLINLAVEDLSSGNYVMKIRAGDVLRSEQLIIK